MLRCTMRKVRTSKHDGGRRELYSCWLAHFVTRATTKGGGHTGGLCCKLYRMFVLRLLDGQVEGRYPLG
jgi:hypothetical protein